MTTHGPIYQMVENYLNNTMRETKIDELSPYEMLQKIQELELKQSGAWISVEERLPEETTEYLVNIVYQVNGKSFTDSAFRIRGTWSDGGSDPFIFKNVTHWQPLPLFIYK